MALRKRSGLAGVAFLLPAAAFAFAVVMARKIVRRGPKDYRSAELTNDGLKIRIELDQYTSARGDFGVFDTATERYTRVGEVTLIDVDQGIAERLIHPHGSLPEALGPVVDWTPDVFFEPSKVADHFKEVNISTHYGAAPAWVFEGSKSDTWVIHIHGAWTDRSIMFRAVHAFGPLGFTSLVPSFRGDVEVTPLQAKISHLGQTEWQDIDCAVAYAVAHGAQRIILSGWSMGGTMALLTAERSAHRDRIVGMVLVGPVTSWRKAITAGAAAAGIPTLGAALVTSLLQVPAFARMLGLEEAINWNVLEWVDNPNRVAVPTLVLHSSADQEVPWDISAAFQRANPQTVTLIHLPDAHHTQEWNASPEAFAHELAMWVSKIIRTES